ncbi:plasma serine protease inhibitor-like [Megalops cyprinoides]|uniref:plasma serine protease inhibitor-like n=1 Tax=Megalops cyprinoides TaxID=118141 RepID=UPI0018641BEE|nr:plasma serine protease inhibitor-like [Megalops cyprinoides]
MELHANLAGLVSFCGLLRGGRMMNASPMLAGLLLYVCLTCTGASQEPWGLRDGTGVSDEVGNFSDHYGDLAFRLYRGLVADRPEENTLFSPLTVSSALAFLSAGAGSRTRAEILSVLGVSNDTVVNVPRAMAALAEFTARLSGDKGGINLTAGSSLHVEKTLSLPHKLRNHSRDGYDRAIRPVDFSKPLQAQKDINAFIKQETGGRITDFLQSLNSSAKSVLANYMYFKGKWQQPFSRRHTVNWRFQVNGTLAAEVPMMFRDDSEELWMLYDTNCSATVVRLPYAGGLAMLLLLPRGDLDQLEPSPCLSAARMKFWRTNLRPGYCCKAGSLLLLLYRRAEIRLPKFVLRKSYPLQSVLEQTGVRTLFTDSADLPGFAVRKGLRIQALHEAILEVDETEADERGGQDAGLDFSEPQRIIFDRPFIFLVYNEPTGTILLIGKIVNPSEN